MTSAPEAAAPLRIMVADDHPLIIEGFVSALRRFHIHAVTHTTQAEQVLALYAEHRPHVLILDVRFGTNISGLDLGRELIRTEPQARIVFCSQFDDDPVLKESYQLGGLAFIPKNTPPQRLAEAVRQAHRGQSYFLPHIAERLARLSLQDERSPALLLDTQELTLFKLLAKGLSHVEIAAAMNLCGYTVNALAQTVRERLGVRRVDDMHTLALKHGLIDVP